MGFCRDEVYITLAVVFIVAFSLGSVGGYFIPPGPIRDKQTVTINEQQPLSDSQQQVEVTDKGLSRSYTTKFASCVIELTRVYDSYNLARPSDKTFNMLCADFKQENEKEK